MAVLVFSLLFVLFTVEVLSPKKPKTPSNKPQVQGSAQNPGGKPTQDGTSGKPSQPSSPGKR